MFKESVFFGGCHGVELVEIIASLSVQQIMSVEQPVLVILLDCGLLVARCFVLQSSFVLMELFYIYMIFYLWWRLVGNIKFWRIFWMKTAYVCRMFTWSFGAQKRKEIRCRYILYSFTPLVITGNSALLSPHAHPHSFYCKLVKSPCHNFAVIVTSFLFPKSVGAQLHAFLKSPHS